MTIWHMSIACWVPTATNTRTEYVKLIAFPLQQWLHTRASMLHYTYSAAPVLLYVYGIFNKHSPQALNSFVKQAFHFSSRGSTCTLTCKDGATLTSFWCYSWNKFMCNGNDSGNFVMQETVYSNLLCLGGSYFFLQNSCHFKEAWGNGTMTVLGVTKWCSVLKLLDRDPSWQQYWLDQHIKDTHKQSISEENDIGKSECLILK
jgi:hypothetical protein